MTTPLIQELVNEIADNIIYGEGFDKLIGNYRVEDIDIVRKNIEKMQLRIFELEGIKVEQSLTDENKINYMKELKKRQYILVYRKSDNLLGLAYINDIDFENCILILKFSYVGVFGQIVKITKFELVESMCRVKSCCLEKYKFNEEGEISDKEISMYKTYLKFD